MTPQERELIQTVAQRLRATPLTEKDHEAERFIQSEIGSQPDALYRLTQTVIVQEQGLRHAQERIQQLEAQVQPSQARPGSFLSSLFGGGSPSGMAAPPPPPPPFGPAPNGSAAGSFLRSAAATAAGVVGGQLIYDGLRNMFGGSLFTPGPGTPFTASPPMGTHVSEQYEPNENLSPISQGGTWQEEDDSTGDSPDVEDSLAGGGDFDTDSQDSDDYDDKDSY
jgi:hypothetical protein